MDLDRDDRGFAVPSGGSAKLMRFGVEAPDPGLEREVPCIGLEKDNEALLRPKDGR